MTTTNDNQLAVRVAQLRSNAGMTQSDLAKTMKALGHDWVQSTVSAIESTSKPRPVRATELFDLAATFGVEVTDFAAPTIELEAFDTHRRFWDAASHLADAVTSMMLAILAVRRVGPDALPAPLAEQIRRDQNWTIEQLLHDDIEQAHSMMETHYGQHQAQG